MRRAARVRAERDEARAAYGWLIASGTALVDVTEQEDAEVLVLDRRIDDLEQSCQDR